MSLTFTYVGREATEEIAATRLRCYGTKPSEEATFIERTRHDRFADGDVLLARDSGQAVGTATSLQLSMSVRGSPVPCQGVAWVGTVRGARRRGSSGPGVATQVMRCLLDTARERGCVLSALMPFRASFYEHFGYGTVERQLVWTIPLGALASSTAAPAPAGAEGDAGNFRHADDLSPDALLACWQTYARAGHGQIITDAAGMRHWLWVDSGAGFRLADVDASTGRVRSQFTLVTLKPDGPNDSSTSHQTVAQIEKPTWTDPAAFVRLLGYFRSLRDQYSAVRIVLPADFPLTWYLKERQAPHRRVEHPAARCELITRMQWRVLDHLAFCDALRVDPGRGGRVIVSVRETEGTESRLAIEFEAGRVRATPTEQSPTVSMTDVTWAAVASGELRATDALHAGLLDTATAPEAKTLDALATGGPSPFCTDYF